ncbi:MAG: hypothetical protein HY698_22230 [Deltaproteobacteria bacterium]|nr:hypothetical protein [Deltaproteobacteria bacterium]
MDLGPAERPKTLLPVSDLMVASQGLEALKAGRYVEARDKLARALQEMPRDPYLRAAYHLALGYEAKFAGRADEARKNFEKVLEYDKYCEEAIRELRAPQGDEPRREDKPRIFSRFFGGKDEK